MYRPTTCVRNIKTVEKNYDTSAEVASHRSNAASHTSSPRYNILRAALRLQSATARRGVRRPSDEAKRWRGYLRKDARTRFAMRPVSAAGKKIKEYD
ncbi:hypothetical protein EVAR_48986_1 [Eumeta japonica]|uniref:Uncharacterized protein n=1 Tax=Eumeta variegata TaxID=151549 RepID=A0A4C1Z2S6_EUMVA|nr:hypothetical protein EVAR_48986_1 [Eumeta japonica]